MNKKVLNKLLLGGDNFIPKLHVGQPGGTYSGCEPFTKLSATIHKLKETNDLKHIYKSKPDKPYFALIVKN